MTTTVLYRKTATFCINYCAKEYGKWRSVSPQPCSR